MTRHKTNAAADRNAYAEYRRDHLATFGITDLVSYECWYYREHR